jgi:hypothetical protein
MRRRHHTIEISSQFESVTSKYGGQITIGADEYPLPRGKVVAHGVESAIVDNVTMVSDSYDPETFARLRPAWAITTKQAPLRTLKQRKEPR